GRAAGTGAAWNGRVDHGNSPRTVDNSAKRTQDRGGRPSRRRQGAATCRLDKSRRVALYLEARHSVQHPARPWISVDRVYAVHVVRRTGRTLAWHGQDRVRPARPLTPRLIQDELRLL